MKLSIVIPVYFNEENLVPLYEDIREKIINVIDYDYEIIMVDDGSQDRSYEVLKQLRERDHRVKIYRLSRNFGSHAAVLCGLSNATGDCAAVKAADIQEPTEMVLEMVAKWQQGYNVVLAVREDREEGKLQKLLANLYYTLIRKTALPNMPKGGFDVFLIDRKVIKVLETLDEQNSAVTGQILWSGFKTTQIYYTRRAREIGKSRWTLKKKIRLVMDTLFSFSTLPVTIVSVIGVICFLVSLIWGIYVMYWKLAGEIPVSGWTTLFLFNLASFGIIMFTLGILGNYLWRTFDASRSRPPYIIEEVLDKEEPTEGEK